jgi:hypothetical protein
VYASHVRLYHCEMCRDGKSEPDERRHVVSQLLCRARRYRIARNARLRVWAGPERQRIRALKVNQFEGHANEAVEPRLKARQTRTLSESSAGELFNLFPEHG